MERRGYTALVTSITSVGNNNSNIALWDDITSARSDLERVVNLGNKIILVAHSYEGVPSSNAVRGLTVRDRASTSKTGVVLMLLYTTSFAIPANMRFVDGVGGIYLDWRNVTVSRLYAEFEVSCGKITMLMACER
jgi:hypothetical protein